MLKTILTFFVAQLLALVALGEMEGQADAAYFNKLRFDAAARDDFSPGWDIADEHTAVIDALKKGDFEKCTTLGEAWLRQTPLDAEIYLVVALARKAQRDLSGYCSYMTKFYGFLGSITSSGDGLSAKTAFKVISVSEEYVLLREIGAKVNSQALDGECDVMVVDVRGKEMTYYFNVKLSLDAQKRELGLK